MSPSCQSPHTDVSRSVKNKKTHYACKIHIACEIFFVIQMAFHIILPSSFKKPCRMWLQKMTSIQSKCLFSQVAEMHTPFEAVRFWQTKSQLVVHLCGNLWLCPALAPDNCLLSGTCRLFGTFHFWRQQGKEYGVLPCAFPVVSSNFQHIFQ